jgi:RNA polymerase sigma factor (TIGR02999 family)
MSAEDRGAVTRLLHDLRAGRREAFDALMPLVYDDLHRRALGYLRRERVGHTLQATALVHEAYLRMVDQRRVEWHDRAHFLAVAAQAMRRILVDHARAQRRQKRGGDMHLEPLDEQSAIVDQPAIDLLAINEALTRLETIDPLQSRLVELRYFGGLTVEETADVLGVSPATVKREWAIARAWLFAAIGGLGASDPAARLTC